MKKYIPNILTTIRIIISLLIPILFIHNNYFLILYLFLFAIISDCFDGMLARKWNVITSYGKITDVIGDKLLAILTISTFISSINKYFIILLIMELIIIVVNTAHFLISKTISNSNSSRIGKIKTILLFVTLLIGCISYRIYISNVIINTLIIITSLMQLITAINYIKINIKKESIN